MSSIKAFVPDLKTTAAAAQSGDTTINAELAATLTPEQAEDLISETVYNSGEELTLAQLPPDTARKVAPYLKQNDNPNFGPNLIHRVVLEGQTVGFVAAMWFEDGFGDWKAFMADGRVFEGGMEA